jgi:hypothetical protein
MAVNPAKATPGQKAIDHRTWNRVVDMLAWWDRLALGNGAGPIATARETDLIRVKNETGETLDKYSIVQVDEYLLTDIDRRRLFFSGSKPTHGGVMTAAS